MNRETLVPAIPDVRSDNVSEVLRAIKATLEVREGHLGDPLDQGVTMRDLTSLNLATVSYSRGSGNGVGPIYPVLPPNPDGYNPETDYTTPPAPTNLRASGGFTNVYLEWDGAPYKNHNYTEIWRSSTDNLGSAVLIGTTAANVYADPANYNSTYYYWIRFVSKANVTGPYNQTSGTVATTAIDVTAALSAISEQIVGSQLFQDLGSRITQIQDQVYLTQSELAVLNEAKERFSALLDANGSAIQLTEKVTSGQATRITQLGTRVTGAESSITTLQSTTATQATQITSLTTRVGSAESNITSLQSTTSTQATQLSSLTTRVGTAESNITSLQTTTANQATSITQLTSSVSGNTTSIQTLTSTTNGLSAQQTVKIDNNGYVTGYGLASTTANGIPSSSFIVRSDSFAIGPSTPPAWSSVTAYSANQTVSYVSNGETRTYQAKLASTNVPPTNTTYWNDITSILPFVVLSQNTVIDGITYPAGTYIKTAFIADATITSAKIQTLVADKITTGNLTAAIGITTGKISGGAAGYSSGTGFWLGNDGGTYKFYIGSPTQNMKWDGTSLSVTGNINAVSGSFRNITVYDTNNNVILSSSGVNTALLGLGSLAYQSSVDRSQTTGFGTLAGQNSVDRSQTTGFGVLAGQDSVTTGQVSGLGSLATQNDVFIGSNVRIWNGGSWVVLNTGDFVNTLSRVSSSNISNFFQTTAITTAYIGDAAINNAKIADLAVNSAKIENLAVTSAKIDSLAVTSAKIANAAVETLKIGGNAVTVPSNAGQITSHTSNLSVGWNGGVYNYGTLSTSYREVVSTTYTISGMASNENAGTIITAYTTLYEQGGGDVVLVTGIFVNGVLNSEVGCTLGESKTNTVVGFVYMPNGTHTISVRIKTDPASGGGSDKNLLCISAITVNSGKR